MTDKEKQTQGLKRGSPTGNVRAPVKRYYNKMQAALDIAIDVLGSKHKSSDGATAIGELIADALEKDVVGTIHKLSVFFPKNVNIDVNVTKDAHDLSDAELEAIVLERRKSQEKQIVADVIDADAAED